MGWGSWFASDLLLLKGVTSCLWSLARHLTFSGHSVRPVGILENRPLPGEGKTGTTVPLLSFLINATVFGTGVPLLMLIFKFRLPLPLSSLCSGS